MKSLSLFDAFPDLLLCSSASSSEEELSNKVSVTKSSISISSHMNCISVKELSSSIVVVDTYVVGEVAVPLVEFAAAPAIHCSFRAPSEPTEIL